MWVIAALMTWVLVSGLLIRNRTAFENARKLTTIIFDKTGTLTRDEMTVRRIVGELGGFDNVYYEICHEPYVAPGAIRTPINMEAWGTQDAYRELMKLIPYKRIGEPEDIAQAIAFLASEAARNARVVEEMSRQLEASASAARTTR